MSLRNITIRDLKLFNKINGYGMMTSAQIQRALFNGVDVSTVLRRLRKLRDRGYLSNHQGLKHGSQVWILKQKAAKLVGSDTFCDAVNRNSLEHDVLVNDLRLALEAVGVPQSWVPGYELKQKAKQKYREDIHREIVPDGIFHTLSHQANINPVFCLELELWAKAKRRYHSLFSDYVLKNGIFKIWYVVPTKSFGERLAKIWEETNSVMPNKHYFAWSLLRDVLENPLEAVLHSKPRSYKLKDIVKPQIKNTPAHPSAQRVSNTHTAPSSSENSQAPKIASDFQNP